MANKNGRRQEEKQPSNFYVTTATGNGPATNLITDKQLRVAGRDVRNMTTMAGNTMNRFASNFSRGSSADMQQRGYVNPTASGSGGNSGRGGKMDREWENHKWESRRRNSAGKWVYTYGDEGQNEKSENPLKVGAAKAAVRINKFMGKNVLNHRPDKKLSHKPAESEERDPLYSEKDVPYYADKKTIQAGEEWLKNALKG